MTKTIDIVLNSKSNTKGFEKTDKKIKELGEAAAKLGEVFGGANTYLGQLVNNLANGSFWKMGATAVGFVFRALKDIWKSAREEAKKAEEAAVKVFDSLVKSIGEYQAAVEKIHAAAVAASDARLKKVKDEIDAVNDLRKAELELECERLRKAGDSKGADAIGERMAELDADAAAAKISAEMEAAERRIAAARQQAEMMPGAESNARAAAATAAAKYAAAEGEVRQKMTMRTTTTCGRLTT